MDGRAPYATLVHMKPAVINKYIVADPKIAGGKLTFKGTRVMVWQVLDALANGESTESILDAWPSITEDHIKAALQFAASRVGSESAMSMPSSREILSR